jgi:F-type H+-transporting ATPase subunit delta
MSNRTSATRYARALFDVAIHESADLPGIQRNLTEIVAAIDGHPELSRVLASRGVSDAARRQLIVAIGEKIGVSAPVSKLLGMLAERRRLDLLPDLAAVFTERLLEHQNVVQADVTTATPIAPETSEAIAASLSSATGKQITMRVTVDPSLLGGVVARVGSTVYDGSVRTQLKKMRDQLVAQG